MKPRKVLRIARWEVTKNAGGIDRRTKAVALVAVVLVAVVTPLVAVGSVGLDDGLYRVAVDEESPYHDTLATDDTFEIVGSTAAYDSGDLADGSVELLVDGREITRADSAKGDAAYEEFRSSIERYNDAQMRQEANQTAAFPVDVVLEFRDQPGTDLATGGGDGEVIDSETGGDGSGDGTDDGTGDGTGDGGDGTDGDGTDRTDGDDDGSGAGGDGDAGTSDGGDGDGESAVGGDDGGFGGLGSSLSDDAIRGSPSEIDPPFPFQSLILAFLFVIPLNFLVQAYGSTILSERINRRGELLLVSPVSRLDIIAGKTLPYFAGAMVLEGILAVGLMYLVAGKLGGLVSLLALAPLVLLFLGATFLGAMFARSFKELTFVTITITVGLTTYAFVPAIFTDIDGIALISPLTLVVRDLQNQAIALPEFVFSTTPPTLVALVFFGLGSGLYREEDMFDQRSISGRVLDALAGPISRRWHVGVMTAVLMPFVFVVQLVAIALLFALGEISIVLILGVVAVTEELAKSLHVYAAYEHRRFDRGLRTAVILGTISGIGFFFGEKIALLAQLVGLPELAIGEAGLVGGVLTGPILLLFLLAPLTLHVVTAGISAVGASRGREQYLGAMVLAMLIHFAYNFAVVSLFVT